MTDKTTDWSQLHEAMETYHGQHGRYPEGWEKRTMSTDKTTQDEDSWDYKSVPPIRTFTALAHFVKVTPMTDNTTQRWTADAIWQSPNWNCPHCKADNMPIRDRCWACGYDSNAGEFPYFNPLPPYEGRNDV